MWLYIPDLPSSQGQVGLNSDSPLRSELITGQSPTLKGSVRPLRSWLRTWKEGGWIRLLSGMTLQPSQGMSLAHSWIESTLSQRDLIASPGRMQGQEKGQRMTDTSGPISPKFLGQFTPNGRFLKTSPDFFEVDSAPSSLILPRSGSVKSNGQVFEQTIKESAHRTNGKGCSSWPTARAAEAKGVAYQYDQGDHNKPRLSLTGEAENWATPTASDDERKVTVNSLQPGLVGDVDRFNGRPVQEALKIGGKLSKSDQTSLPRLNPRFVEWLMGWPEDWLELSSFVSSETE